MKNLFLIVAICLLSLQSFSQVGVITIEANTKNVPFGQWYVSKDIKLENHTFFYTDEPTASYMVYSILDQEGQSLNLPYGIDSDGDLYWIVLWENGFTSTIYLATSNGFSLITVVTE